ncbi:hypothetical protein AGDE_15214 [Angomonas deanei]|nr:hypothetical protein AGDE_15214 [Angomonas deanei]|eukprot:EPY19488.1 hypothetical protein AGDE_15214 [Angomonas deanei]
MTDHSKNKNHHHENAEQYKYAVRIAPTSEMMEVLLSHIATNDDDEKRLLLYHQTAARDKERFIYSVHKTNNNHNHNDVCVYSFSSYVFLRQYYNFLLEHATPMAQNSIKALLISIYYCFTQLDTLTLEESVSREIISTVKEVQNTAEKQYSTDVAEMKEHVTTLAHKIINSKNKKDSEINMENVKSLLKEEPHKTEQTVDRYRKEEYEKLVERLTFNRHESFVLDTLTKVHRPHKNSPSHNILLLSFVLELCLVSVSGLTSDTVDLQYPNNNNNGIKQIFHYTLLVATLLDEMALHNNSNNNNLCVNGVVKSILLSPLNNNSNNNKASNIFSSFEFSQIFTLKPFLQCQFMLFSELNNNNNNFSALMKLLWTDVEENQLSTLFRTVKHDNAVWSLYEGISSNSDNRLLQHYLKTSFLTPSLSLLLWIAGRVHYKQDERFNVKLLVAWLDGILEWNKNHNNNNNDRCYAEDVTALRNVLRQRL